MRHSSLMMKNLVAAVCLGVTLLAGEGPRAQAIGDGFLDREVGFEVVRDWQRYLDSNFFALDLSGGPEDAGDYSFVRQMVPVLFGRKLKGYDELTMLVDLLRATGGDRAKLMQVLLREDSPYNAEYVEHWSDYLVAQMRFQRDGDKRMGSCFGESSPPRIDPRGPSAKNLAQCILASDASADCSAGATFNMWDVVRSSIALDNLSPAYRAYLFALVSFPIPGAEVTPHNEQDDISEAFQHVYIHRNLGCLGCHNTAGSVSGVTDINGQVSFWNRHFPVEGNFEVALFGTASGRNDVREVNQLFRANIGSGSERPFGLSSCGTFKAKGAADTDGRYPSGYTPPVPYLTAPLAATASVWEAEELLKSGYRKLALYGLRRNKLIPPGMMNVPGCVDHCQNVSSPPPIGTAPASLGAYVTDPTSGCALCHKAGHSSGLNLTGDWQRALVSVRARTGLCSGYNYLVVPDDAGASCVADLVNGNAMPPGGAPMNRKTELTNWIGGLAPGAGCDPNLPSYCTTMVDHDNDAGFAYLVAMNIVSQAWREVTGEALTIANYFPRNASQRDILRNLTETVFIARGWSLQSLLIAILASEHFNRRAPANATRGSAYVLATHLKPFEVNDPRRPPEALPGWESGDPAPTPNLSHLINHLNNEPGRSRHYNAMSDGVHRFSAEHLFNAVHAALGWPAAAVGPSASYPDDRLRKGIGQFYSDVEPGFGGVNFQSLITWESELGLCDNPTANDDWIDRVVDRVDAAPGRYTRRDLIITLRDWLIGNGEIGLRVPVGQTANEEALLNALFGATPGSDVLDLPLRLGTTAQRTDLDAGLRRYCGVLVESPQFLLAGIADEHLGPRPALRVCNGSPCTFRELCEALRPAAERGFRVDLSCGDDCLIVEQRQLPGERFPTATICPGPICDRIPWVDVADFVRDPIFCLERPDQCPLPEPPRCDLGCKVIDCCGGPLPPIDGAGYFLGLAEGGVVEYAEGIWIIRYGQPKPDVLKPGEELAYGDYLIMPPGSRIRINAPAGIFETPAYGVPDEEKSGWNFLVTANRTADQRTLDNIGVPVGREGIKRALTPPWLGEDGKRFLPVEFLQGPEDERRIKQEIMADEKFEKLPRGNYHRNDR